MWGSIRPPQGTLYYRYCGGPPELLGVEASMSILILFSVNVFPKQYKQKHFLSILILGICILNEDSKFKQDL